MLYNFYHRGMMKMKFKKFLWFSLLGGIIWSGLLVFIGYFYGSVYKSLGVYLKNGGIIVFILALLTIVGLTILKNKQSKKILTKQKA